MLSCTDQKQQQMRRLLLLCHLSGGNLLYPITITIAIQLCMQMSLQRPRTYQLTSVWGSHLSTSFPRKYFFGCCYSYRGLWICHHFHEHKRWRDHIHLHFFKKSNLLVLMNARTFGGKNWTTPRLQVKDSCIFLHC